MRRYVIIGTGAVGGAIGGRLAQHGKGVVWVARGANATVLRSSGLVLRTPDEVVSVRAPVAEGPGEVELTTDDVLVLATKAHQAGDALAAWSTATVRVDGEAVGTAGQRLPLLTAVNGVAVEPLALRWFRRVYGVSVWLPALLLRPGEVFVRMQPRSGTLHVARYPAVLADADDADLLSCVHDDWGDAGFDVELPTDVMTWKYRKLITNMGNAFQALVGRNGDWHPLADAATDEARAVLAKAAIEVVSEQEWEQARARTSKVTPVPGQPEEMGGSSWQSLARGAGSIETDYLNGEIVLLAHQHGLSAPINAGITTLARQAAVRGHRPGDISAADLARQLGLSLT